MNNKIKVSILIPLYNQALLIKRCLSSIPKRNDIEIIVVDDQSTDDSYTVVANNFSNVKLFKNEKNLGVGLTRNILMDKATGKYLFFLDSDDYLYTSEFNKVVDSILADQNILQAKHMRNDGKVFFPGVHRGDFLKKEFVGNLKHQDMRCHEDSDFKVKLRKLPGYKIDKLTI